MHFDNFGISDKQTQIVDLDPNVAFTTGFRVTVPTTVVTTSTTNTNKSTSIFEKGIKRDSVLFFVLKEENK